MSLKKNIPVNTPLLDGNEKKYLLSCINDNWISSEGPFVKKFEDAFKKLIGKKYASAVSSGTAALDIAIESLNLKEGDEVILPSFTIVSCLNHIIRKKLKPVFIDSNPDTWNMDIEKFEQTVSSKTKLVIVVHIYGLPTEMDKIIQLKSKYGFKLIEDCAEAHGLKYKNKHCGTFGDISTYSFYPNKLITTGEGGMLLTNNKRLHDKFELLKNLAFKNNKRFHHDEIGWNYRMTNMQAALGLAQLENIDKKIKKKYTLGGFYTKSLKNIDCIMLQPSETAYAKNIFWVFGIVIKSKKINAIDIMKKLAKFGIGTRPFFFPLHRQPLLKKYIKNYNYPKLPVSEMLYKKGFYIPSGLGLKTNEQAYIIKKLKDILIKL